VGLELAPDLRLPLPTVVHVQRRFGLARRPRPARAASPPVSARPPGELVHLDIKKLGRFRRVGHRIHGDHGRRSRGSGSDYLHIAIDDRTRLAYAALFPDETAASAAAFPALAHRWFATLGVTGVTIRALLTDNGSAYRIGGLAALGMTRSRAGVLTHRRIFSCTQPSPARSLPAPPRRPRIPGSPSGSPRDPCRPGRSAQSPSGSAAERPRDR
jgi:hypothetical protein